MQKFSRGVYSFLIRLRRIDYNLIYFANLSSLNQKIEMEQGKQKHPIFNGEWEIMSSLGEGNTSKVYLARNMKDKRQVALKLLREEFLQRDADSIKSVEQEIQIL